MSKLIISCVFLSIMGFTALAETQPSTKHTLDLAHEKCVEADGSTLGMKQCNATFEKRWDQELNKYYQLLGGNKNPELLKTQLSWIKFRDAEWRWIDARYTQIYKDSGGGTMWGLLATVDHMEVVRKRALELRGFYFFKKCGMTGDCDNDAWGE